MKPIVYVMHPVTGDPVANAQRTIRWVRWFVENDEDRIYIAPWVAEVLSLAEETFGPEFYQRVLDDDCEVIARLDAAVGVGGRWSSGMLQERATARAKTQPVLDLTRFEEPPTRADLGESPRTWLRTQWRDA